MLQKETDKHDIGAAGATFLSAQDLSDYMMQRRQADRAHEEAREREMAKAQQEQIKRLMVPVEITQERLAGFMLRVRQAAEQGQNDILVLRFPSDLCTDRGRAISNAELDWGKTLVGVPAQVIELWEKELKPRGYGLRAEVIDYPHGMPGDIGLYCHW
jgi:alkanesulfonate monooxygenase SsuD/methylene tetrahydromethanopterin reductase-like flavin-dependent oxidoreductase (luciferase family)